MGTSTMCGHYVCHVLKEGRYSFLYLIFPPFEPNFTLFLFSIIFINVCVVYLRFKGARLRMSQLERKFFKIVYKLPLSSLFLIVLIFFFLAYFHFYVLFLPWQQGFSVSVDLREMWTRKKSYLILCYVKLTSSFNDILFLRWVIFNDRKVALSEKPPKELGYLYLYKRVDS